MWSLKGAAADMSRYMGRTASVSEIFGEAFGHLWHHHVFRCVDAKFLQNLTRK